MAGTLIVTAFVGDFESKGKLVRALEPKLFLMVSFTCVPNFMLLSASERFFHPSALPVRQIGSFMCKNCSKIVHLMIKA